MTDRLRETPHDRAISRNYAAFDMHSVWHSYDFACISLILNEVTEQSVEAKLYSKLLRYILTYDCQFNSLKQATGGPSTDSSNDVN